MGFLEERLKAVGDGISDMGSGWSYKSIIIVIVLIAAFLGVAYYTYITYIEPSMRPTYVTNNEFQTEQSAKDAEEHAKCKGNTNLYIVRDLIRSVGTEMAAAKSRSQTG